MKRFKDWLKISWNGETKFFAFYIALSAFSVAMAFAAGPAIAIYTFVLGLVGVLIFSN